MGTELELDLAEVANQLELSVEQLIRYAAKGELTITAIAKDWVVSTENGAAGTISGPVQLLPEDLQLCYNTDSTQVRKVKKPNEGQLLVLESPVELLRGLHHVTAGEFERFCRAHATSPRFGQDLPSYLNKHHDFYAPELAIAVQAWMALFAGGTYERKGRGVKIDIDVWLSKARPPLSQAARARIATLVNPKVAKIGGASKTPTK